MTESKLMDAISDCLCSLEKAGAIDATITIGNQGKDAFLAFVEEQRRNPNLIHPPFDHSLLWHFNQLSQATERIELGTIWGEPAYYDPHLDAVFDVV